MTNHTGKILVVGAGAGGIQASLDLAQAGYQVILAEASGHTGGLLSQLDVQFPTSSCGFCRMLPMADRDKGSQHCLRRGLSHENIDLRFHSTLMALEGEPGAFTAALDQGSPMVNQDKCMGCGICETVCPVEIPDAFNAGLTTKKAVFRPSPQSFANAWTIDPGACTLCGECESVCPTQAITLHPSDRAGFKILVVDDEAIVRDSMKEWLGLEGFGVQTAESGYQALQMLEKETFHVMLTDIKMPGMDGVQLLSRAKEIRPDITVVMMTAYAEVDSAVNAMKEGALDYVTKPFEPDKVIGIVENLYGAFKAGTAVKEEVDAVILAMGTGFYHPDQGKNIYGYGTIPNVVTALEFERMLSPAGPGPGSGPGAKRVAWIQCAGSRDRDHGFCSSVCCMISVKQSLLAQQQWPQLERAEIFYMDMRTPGKDFQAYRDMAQERGVAFTRSRIHSIAPGTGEADGAVTLRYVQMDGGLVEQAFDIVVLALGQAVPAKSSALINALDLETDNWGFVRAPAFAPYLTSQPGIFTCGGLTGFADIETTVTLGAAAAMSAVQIMADSGKQSLKAPQAETDENGKDDTPGDAEVLRGAPNIQVMICRCTRYLDNKIDPHVLAREGGGDPAVGAPDFVDDLCTPEGWDKALALLDKSFANRLIVAGCPACIKAGHLAELGRTLGIASHLVQGIDSLGLAGRSGKNGAFSRDLGQEIRRAVTQLKSADPMPAGPGASFDRALVVGGGVAGMTTALAIARAGFGVDLVEKTPDLGGNLLWIKQTIEGDDTQGLLDGLAASVCDHDLIRVHLSSRVADVAGRPGKWTTRLEPILDKAGTDDKTEPDIGAVRVPHGVVVLATGGQERQAQESGPGIYTQQAFQTGLDAGTIDPADVDALAMILCRGCREKDRNYCSRVCCPRALKQALDIKQMHPDTRIYILYRDMMATGHLEGYYTRAREQGIIFIAYEKEKVPEILTPDCADGLCTVACHDPILDRDVEIDADAVVLATGVVPDLPGHLADMFTAQIDEFGFFKAADPKWRPMDGLHPRVLGCGLALKPCDLALAGATGQAAAIRAVGILSGVSQGAAARVRPAYCSQCLVCIPACPFNARALDEQSATIVVDAQACQGCGICAAVCPSKAAIVDGAAHYLDVIDGILAP